MSDQKGGEKARRRADQAMVASYHEAKLADLLEHVRKGFGEYDAGRLDAFELDEIIQQYKRSTIELWKFCSVTGLHLHLTARTLEDWQAQNEDPDWWAKGASRRREWSTRG